MKKLVSLVLIALMCISVSAFARERAFEPEIKLIVDDKIVPTETVTINDRTLIPLRALMESTGAKVDWLHEDFSADVTKDGKKINVKIDSKTMTTPDGTKEMDVAPILYNGDTTYVPLRAICEEFGFSVDWDEDTRTILINDPAGCPYVDIYDGYTLGDYIEESGTDPIRFELETGLDYEYYKDKPFVLADNSITVSYVAQQNNMTLEELGQTFGVDTSSKAQMKWGVFVGELTMQQYLDVYVGVSQYNMTAQEALESIKTTYGFGDEYTLGTKYKYMRTIMDVMDCEYKEQEEARLREQEAKLEQDKLNLPALLENKIYFTITMSDGSEMKGELYPDLAPITVQNFVTLCEDGFYNGLIFHRVIDGFMIQGGAFDKDFNAKTAQPIVGEFYANGITNALSHEKGVISMARTDEPNSASSQFFIMDEDTPSLDGQYAAFGRITEGLDVVDKISQTKTQTNEKGYTDVPAQPVIIKNIKINK